MHSREVYSVRFTTSCKLGMRRTHKLGQLLNQSVHQQTSGHDPGFIPAMGSTMVNYDRDSKAAPALKKIGIPKQSTSLDDFRFSYNFRYRSSNFFGIQISCSKPSILIYIVGKSLPLQDTTSINIVYDTSPSYTLIYDSVLLLDEQFTYLLWLTTPIRVAPPTTSPSSAIPTSIDPEIARSALHNAGAVLGVAESKSRSRVVVLW